MPLVTGRKQVLDIYKKAAEKKWVIPTFCSENLTTTEAILSAYSDYSKKIGMPDIPVTIAITNQYSHRSQSVNYTNTRKWDIGLKLFTADIEVLTSPGSPFESLNVMTLLDHTQWDSDAHLLKWDMSRFSMIMYDASTLPFEENIRKTAEFVKNNGQKIVIEGACDEIIDAGGNEASNLTTPENAKQYIEETGVDFIVANLGTEHRASAEELKYHDDLARNISRVTGPKLVLHGTSSVKPDQLENLFEDGVAKVNIWTCLERDSSPDLFIDMVKNAAKIIGSDKARELTDKELLGKNADTDSDPMLSHYTTMYRQEIVFGKMKEIVTNFLEMWYR